MIVVPREGSAGAVNQSAFAETLRKTVKAVAEDLMVD